MILEKIQLAPAKLHHSITADSVIDFENSSAGGVVTEKLGHIVHAVCLHFNTSFSL